MRSRIAEYLSYKHLILFRMAMEISMSLNVFKSVTSWSVNKRSSADFFKSRSAPLCVGLVPYFALPTRRLRVRVVGKALPTLSEDKAIHGVLPSSETSPTDRPSSRCREPKANQLAPARGAVEKNFNCLRNRLFF